MSRLVIVGAGVSGLATAFCVRRRIEQGDLPGWTQADVLVLEAAPRPGGFCVTEQVDGYLLDWGPNGFLDSEPATLRLVDELGLRPRLRPASDAAARRFLYLDGRLRPIPTRPDAFLLSPLLSLRAKLRLLAEPLVPPRRDGRDESVASFARRRVGAEFVRRLLDPMISGVYAGDVERLSLEGALPKMAALEREHGSLVAGLLARRREARRRGRRAAGPAESAGPAGPAGPSGVLHTFAAGIGELTETLARACGAEIRCGCRVTGLRRANGDASGGDGSDRSDGSGRARGPGGGFLVEFAEGRAEGVGSRDTGPDAAPAPLPTASVRAAQVVLALPAREAAALLAGLDVALAAPLLPIVPSPIAVASLGYDARGFDGPTDGFGFLIPRSEGIRTLGVLWTSSIFPFEAPPGKVLLRALAGGSHDPQIADVPDDEVLRIVLGDVARTMGVRARPELARLFRYREGIPQYAVGHRRRLEDLASCLRAWPGLQVTGNSLYGISVNHCAKEAIATADRIVAVEAAVR